MTKYIPKKIRLFSMLFLLASLLHLGADEVEVFAASSLTDALKEIAANYEKTGSDKIIFNFAASSVLDMQIKAGGPADLFFSADEAKMNDLEKQGLIAPNSRKDLLSNTLAIVVASDSSATLTSAAQLADPQFKSIALGQPQSVPAGIYAKEYLQKIGIWSQVEPKVIPCENVRAALAAVESGNVAAGIVYKTDAMQSHKVKVAYEVAAADGPAIVYPAALLQASKHAAAAQAFLDYLGQPSSQTTFEKYGFGVITKK
jgi:molybdate transport system substrate-binding protein